MRLVVTLQATRRCTVRFNRRIFSRSKPREKTILSSLGYSVFRLVRVFYWWVNIERLSMYQAIVLMFSLFLSISVLAFSNGATGTLLTLRITEAGFSPLAVGFISSGYFAGMIAGPFYAQRLIAFIGYIRSFAAFGSTFSAALLLHPFLVDPVLWTMLRAIEGVCIVGMYICAESWINEKTTNDIRGQVFSIYALLVMGMVSLGQFVLKVPDASGIATFVLVSALASLAVVPVAITKVEAPPPPQLSKIDFAELYAISPLAVIAALSTGALQGAAYGLGPIYAQYLGLDVSGVTWVYVYAARWGGGGHLAVRLAIGSR